MAFEEENDTGAISQINVTPLVDVMLVLLVIFMVTAPILQQGVQLELPKESIAPLEGSNEEQLVVSVTQDGKVFLGSGNEIEPKELGIKLAAIISERKDKQVYIKADRRVAYGVVMAVMGSLRRNGITDVGLVTEPS